MIKDTRTFMTLREVSPYVYELLADKGHILVRFEYYNETEAIREAQVWISSFPPNRNIQIYYRGNII